MNTEQKIFNELIETVLKNSTANIATITNVKLWAESWQKEMKEALILNGVSHQREQLLKSHLVTQELK